MTENTGTLVVGIGSPHGDDQAGWKVAEEIRNCIVPHDTVIQTASVPLDLLNYLPGFAALHIIDAIEDSSTSTMTRFSWPLAASVRNQLDTAKGTHGFDLISVLTLADTLKLLPPHVTIWAVATSQFAPVTDISPETKELIDSYANQILQELSDARAITGAVTAE